MNEIKHFMLPAQTNSLYEKEAISSISLTKEVASKINELVDAYNELNKTNYEKIQEQDGTIRKAIIYIKDELKNTIEDMLDTMEYSGELKQIMREQLFQEILAEIEAKASKEQYANQDSRITSLENGKVDKNANESISYKMLSQEVKEKLTGGKVPVVGANSVNTSNVVDGAITHNKLNKTLKNQIAKTSAMFEGELKKVDFNPVSLETFISYSAGFIKTRLNETGSPIKIKINAGAKTIPNECSLVINLDNYKNYNEVMEPTIYAKTSGESNLYNGNYIILFDADYGYFGGLMMGSYRSNLKLENINDGFQKTILKGNPQLLGSILNMNYNHATSKMTVSYDRSYLYMQKAETGSPLYNIIPAGTVELTSPGFLAVKVSDMKEDGTEVTPIVCDASFSRMELFNGDYIILLSNQYGRIGGLFAHNTIGLTSQSDLTIDDSQIYLKVNSATSITLLKKCSESDTSYLGVNFERFTDATKKCDIWRLNGIKKYNKSGSDFTADTISFVTEGEIESAIKISGASDFVGGYIHGYETNKNIEIYIDGKLIDVSKVAVYSGKNITINRISEMYDYGTENVFANHNCIYEFTNEGLILSQYVNFKLTKTLNRSYLGMFPVARKVNDNYVSNKAVFFPTLENMEVYEGHTNTAQKLNVNGVLLTNKENSGHGFMAKVEVLEKNVPTLKINISDAEQYNKVYPATCEDTHNVKAGDVWTIKTKYEFEYKGLN